jgi:ABC-type phosphate/phosphonate transport system permease subunit
MIKNMQFVIMLLSFISLTATILLLIAIKILRKVYIRKAKDEIKKMKGKEQVILYRVKDNIECSLLELNKCSLVITGFDAVCETLRKHWNPNDNLKMIYTIKGNDDIEIKIFFNDNGNWKQIEGLYNLSDGLNYVNRYEVTFKVNKKIRSLLQTLIICDIALWIGVIISCIISFFKI